MLPTRRLAEPRADTKVFPGRFRKHVVGEYPLGRLPVLICSVPVGVDICWVFNKAPGCQFLQKVLVVSVGVAVTTSACHSPKSPLPGH